MNRPKLNWEKLNQDELMRKRGSVSIWDDPPPIETIPLWKLMKDRAFPRNALGKIVKTQKFTGKVTEIFDEGSKIKITDSKNRSKIFSVELLRAAERRKQSPKR